MRKTDRFTEYKKGAQRRNGCEWVNLYLQQEKIRCENWFLRNIHIILTSIFKFMLFRSCAENKESGDLDQWICNACFQNT